MGTWHDPDVGRPIAAPLEQCAQLLGTDLPTVRKLAAKVEPYLRADGTRIWSLTQLERQLRPAVYGRRLPRPSTNAAVALTGQTDRHVQDAVAHASVDERQKSRLPVPSPEARSEQRVGYATGAAGKP